MIRNITTLSGAILALTLVAAPSGAQERSPEPAAPHRSSIQGLSVAVYASNASLFLVEDRTSTYGSGLGLSVGYGLSSRFGIHASTSGAVLKPSASDIWLLGHVDLEARYTFAGIERSWAPHVALGIGGRTTNHEVLEESTDVVWHSNPGVTLGSGVSYFPTPGFSLDAGLRYSFGNLRNMSCPKGGDEVSTCATSTRINLGATWYHRAR